MGLGPSGGNRHPSGTPLAGFQVVFWADVEAGAQGPRATGFTDATGHYQLHTDTSGRGAAIGRYHVCLLKPHGTPLDLHANQTKDKDSAPAAVELPLAYASSKETPLRAEIRSGPQALDFDIP